MKIKARSGSKERLFEMFHGVNKNNLKKDLKEWYDDSYHEGPSKTKDIDPNNQKQIKELYTLLSVDGIEDIYDHIGPKWLIDELKDEGFISEDPETYFWFFTDLGKKEFPTYDDFQKWMLSTGGLQEYDPDYPEAPYLRGREMSETNNKRSIWNTDLWDKRIEKLKNNVSDVKIEQNGPNAKIKTVKFTDGSEILIDPLDTFNRVKVINRETPTHRDTFADSATQLYTQNKMSYEHIWKIFDEEEKQIEETPIDKKENSDPYGGSNDTFQNGMGYGDEKPINSKLRAKSPELEKFVKEEENDDGYENVVFLQGDEATEPLNILMNQGRDEALEYLKQWHSPGEHGQTEDVGYGSQDFHYEKDGYTMSWNPYVGYIGLVYDTSNINESEEGEKTLKSKIRILYSDLDFSRMADAYKNLINIKHSEFKNTDVIQQTIDSLKNSLANYLRNVKNLNVDENDIERYFEQQNVSAEMVESDENQEEEEAPALDTEDVDNDGEKLEGGLADGESVMDYDPEEILKGIEVEMEHTKDPRVAIEITMDHLEEFFDYYTRLEKMENQAEEDVENLNSDENESTDNLSVINLDDIPDDLKQHGEVINNSDDEFENSLLGFNTQTPNKMGEEKDFASREKEYHDNDEYKRYQELDSKDFNLLPDDEKEEFFILWQEFGR